MRKKLIVKASQDLIEMKLTNLREKVNNTLFCEDKYYDRNALIDEIQTIKLNFEELKQMDVENILFYLNYNKKFALSRFVDCRYDDRLTILEKLLTLDMNKKSNKVHFVDFMVWSVGYLYKDKDMAKLVQFFCDNTTIKDYNLIHSVHSLYSKIFDESLCKDIIANKYTQIKAEQENILKSKTNL